MSHRNNQRGSTRTGLLQLFGLVGLVMMLALPAGTARAQETAGMALAIEGAGVSCDAATCDVPLGGDFTLAIRTDGPPSEGYIAHQTLLYYGGLIYNATETPEDENGWPDFVLFVRSPQEPTAEDRSAAHGAMSSLTPPFTVSTFEGDLVVLSMSCTSEDETFTVALLAFEPGNPLGSTYSIDENQTTTPLNIQSRMLLDPINQGEVVEVPVADSISVNCGDGGPGGEIIPTVPPGNGNGPPPAGATLPPPEATEAAVATEEFLASVALAAEAAATSEAAATNEALGTPPAGELTTTLGGTPTATDGGDTDGEDDDGDSNTVLWIIIAIIVIAALAVAGVLGWRYWQARQDQSEPPE